MKILVTGARTFRNRLVVARAFDDVSRFAAVHGGPVVVIHGGAPGADLLCEVEAHSRGWHTALIRALWPHYGKPAGHIRNDVMVYLGAHAGCRLAVDHDGFVVEIAEVPALRGLHGLGPFAARFDALLVVEHRLALEIVVHRRPPGRVSAGWLSAVLAPFFRRRAE